MFKHFVKKNSRIKLLLMNLISKLRIMLRTEKSKRNRGLKKERERRRKKRENRGFLAVSRLKTTDLADLSRCNGRGNVSPRLELELVFPIVYEKSRVGKAI